MIGQMLLATMVAAVPAPHGKPKPKEAHVAIAFRAMVGDRPFSCSEHYQNLGRAHVEVYGSEFKFYVHGVRLVRKDGTEVPVALDQDSLWQSGSVAMLDFEDAKGACSNGTPATRDVVRGTVPEGKYTGVRFIVGVPFERNHLDLATQPPPLSLTQMFWAWSTGYKFVRIDLKVMRPDTNATVGWSLHLGSTGCAPRGPGIAPTSCTNPNRPEITFDKFDLAHDAIALDLAAIVANADLLHSANDSTKLGAGCMSSPTDRNCSPLLAAFGLGSAASDAAAVQVAFRQLRKAVP